MNIKEVIATIQKRNPHRAVKSVTAYETSQFNIKYVCYFENGDYATYWKWANEDRLTCQMNHGRWRNRKTGKEIELTF